jgi:hypothetical protein
MYMPALRHAWHLPLATGKGSRNLRRPADSAAMPACSTCSADTCSATRITTVIPNSHPDVMSACDGWPPVQARTKGGWRCARVYFRDQLSILFTAVSLLA